MSDHFINLNCANCGAKLDVYDDMERFACGYCGTEMVVQRRGGTVALKAVTEAIHKVQIGTDKTAAELALARLERELQELRRKTAEQSAVDECRRIQQKNSRVLGFVGFGCGALSVLIGIAELVGGGKWDSVAFVLVGAVIAWAGYLMFPKRQGPNNKESAELTALRDQVRQLENQIAKKRRVANG